MAGNGRPCLPLCAGTQSHLALPPWAAAPKPLPSAVHSASQTRQLPGPSVPTKAPPPRLMAAYQTVCPPGFPGFYRLPRTDHSM